MRYVNGCIRIRRGNEEKLKEEVKKMEDKKKGIQSEQEAEQDSKIRFLDVEIIRKADEQTISTR